jgi:gamma-butyrobetaine dioxygenase
MGIVIFDKLSDDASAGENFADLIGFKRETNFGVMFNVISKPDPNNLAYTSDALPLHIDLTNQELVPGYQFLHCVVNDAMGGQSVFADGYKICADLRSADPESFERLKKIEIPCRFHDAICDIRYRRPVISQDANGNFSQLVFNAHIADVPDMPADELCEFYEAYQQLMRLAREPEYAINHQLKAGEMVMFDNRRVMHGRAAFDTAAGTRHLRGFYIDRNEVDSRIRVLSRG